MLLECPGSEWSQSDLGRGEVKWKVTQSCQTVFKAMDCGLTGSPVREILQARILEWVDIPFSRESS